MYSKRLAIYSLGLHFPHPKIQTRCVVALVTKHEVHPPYSELSSEANSHSLVQEMLCPSWNLTVHCSCHNSLPQHRSHGQMTPLHTITPYSIYIHFRYCIPFYAYDFEWFRFSDHNFLRIFLLYHLYHISSSFKTESWQYLVNCASYKAPHFTLLLSVPSYVQTFSSASCSQTQFVLNLNVIVIHHVLNCILCCIFHVIDQTSHPCKSTSKNLVQSILSLVSRQQKGRQNYCEQNSSSHSSHLVLLQFLHEHNFCYCHSQTKLYLYLTCTTSQHGQKHLYLSLFYHSHTLPHW
jgi:hypothetical protein